MCHFAWGDADGGTEKLLGNTATEDECAQKVMRTEPNANAATYGDGGKCFAEYEAIGINDKGDDKFRTCLFDG